MAPRGRPRGFDRDDALLKAMDLFWRHGYEGVSIADLAAGMGINSPSLYAAFGSKETLFFEAVQRFGETAGDRMLAALSDAPSARAGIAAMLRSMAECVTTSGKPTGCMITLAATNCSPANGRVEAKLCENRRRTVDALRVRLVRAVEEGELPATTDVPSLATYFATVLNGLSLQARDGATRSDLMASVDHAMAAFDRTARLNAPA
ncbi:TetR/AcrR family transcriptional regulator [Chthonobacter rhizosphaerae]|uniref:TetR/AcrR family transcriptional regulator n=1 Tax=Chthonobacter rhizosphaerae TaxID=2735553 RepID=UPI0015EF7BF6|nr:TetR/AcrR family transcriptional regulator [Chthonobacter rhizosphaerae]